MLKRRDTPPLAQRPLVGPPLPPMPDPVDPERNDAAPGGAGVPGAGRTEAERRRRAGGRPRRRPGTGDPVGVLFQVSVAERDRLRELAGAAGLSVSEFVRRRALGGRIAPLAEAVDRRETRRELNRLGVNLNQLVRRANEAAPLLPAERAAAVGGVVDRAWSVLDGLEAALDALRLSARVGPGRGRGDADVSDVRGEP